MQAIQLKSMDDGYYFQCGICNQFPEIAVECKHCSKLYCVTCSQLIHSQEKQGCACRLRDLEIMEPFQQYVYSRLTIKCKICQQVLALNKIKRHQIKCQNKLSNQKLYNDKLFDNVNVVQKNPSQNHPSFNYQNYLNCQKSPLFQYQLKEYQLSNLPEDAINQLQSILFQCKICQQEGSLFLMRQHHLFCKQKLVYCICGFKERREIIQDHLLKCLQDELNNYQNQKQQIQLSINLKQIAFNQLLIQNRHVSRMIVKARQFQSFDQDFETWDQN